jgi:hypothetical protein
MADKLGQFFKQPSNHSDLVDPNRVQPSQATQFVDPPHLHPGEQPVPKLSTMGKLPAPPEVKIVNTKEAAFQGVPETGSTHAPHTMDETPYSDPTGIKDVHPGVQPLPQFANRINLSGTVMYPLTEPADAGVQPYTERARAGYTALEALGTSSITLDDKDHPWTVDDQPTADFDPLRWSQSRGEHFHPGANTLPDFAQTINLSGTVTYDLTEPADAGGKPYTQRSIDGNTVLEALGSSNITLDDPHYATKNSLEPFSEVNPLKYAQTAGVHVHPGAPECIEAVTSLQPQEFVANSRPKLDVYGQISSTLPTKATTSVPVDDSIFPRPFEEAVLAGEGLIDQHIVGMNEGKWHDVKVAELSSNKNVITPGYDGLIDRLGEQFLKMYDTVSVEGKANVSIPGIPGMPGVEIPVGAKFSTHGGKIQLYPTPEQVEQAARQYAQNALTYGKAQAEAAASALLKKGADYAKNLLAGRGQGFQKGNIKNVPFLPNGETPVQKDGKPVKETSQGTVWTEVKIDKYQVAPPNDPYSNYAAEARDAVQAKQEEAASYLESKLVAEAGFLGGTYNADNTRSKIMKDAESEKWTQNPDAPPQTLEGFGVNKDIDTYPLTANRYSYDVLTGNDYHTKVQEDQGYTSADSTKIGVVRSYTYAKLPEAVAQTLPPLTNLPSNPVGSTPHGIRTSSSLDVAQNKSHPSIPAGGSRLKAVVEAKHTTIAVPRASVFAYGENKNIVSPTALLPFDSAGSITVNDAGISKPEITDEQMYVPLVITDMRRGKNGFKAVHFRPFIKSLSETFAPTWSMDNYFGRVDKVATYQSTDRTISLSFQLVCFQKADLQAIYQKLGWLTSMVYPSYEGANYHQGPLVRLRVGDVISANTGLGGRGLPGVITNLEFDYSEATWDTDANNRLPMKVDVTLGFHVLHEHSVGSVEQKFGGVAADNSVKVGRFRAAVPGDYLG